MLPLEANDLITLIQSLKPQSYEREDHCPFALNNIIWSNQILFIPANMKTTGPPNTVEYMPLVTKLPPVFSLICKLKDILN